MHPIRTLLRLVLMLAAMTLAPARTSAADGSSTPVVIDVLTLYTTTARDSAGGLEPLRSTLLSAFAEANQIYSNSLIEVRLNPVAIVEAPYTEVGDLGHLANEVSTWGAALRTTHRADLVVVVVENDYLGRQGFAGPGTPGQTGQNGAAYIGLLRLRTTGLGAAIANRTGWLMGAGTDVTTDGNPSREGAFAYARGHRFEADGQHWATVMSSLNGMRIPYFSNPEVSYRGVPTGIRNVADNASSIRLVAPKVAAYRTCTNRVQFEVVAATVSEAAAGVEFKVLREGPTDTTATVRVQNLVGPAQSGIDYQPISVLLEFAPGETEKRFTVQPINDTSAQGSRELRVRLTAPGVGTGVGHNHLLTITLEDDDTPFEFGSPSIALGEGGSAERVRLVRRGSADGADTVQLNLSAESTSGASRLLASVAGGPPSTLPVPVPFAPGETAAEILLSAAEDSRASADEKVVVHLSTAAGVVTHRQASLEVWIRDNDRGLRLDESFQPGTHFDGIERPTLLLPDGSFLAARRTAPGGAVTLVRLNADGSPHPEFRLVRFQDEPASGAGLRIGRLGTLTAQVDGRILAAGYFAGVNGQPASHLVRLLPDGSLDPEFRIGRGPSGPVHAVCIQEDGKIVVGGEFTSFNGQSRRNMARLHPDGSLDSTFQPEILGAGGAWVTCVASHREGLLIGGFFDSVDGLPAAGFARLNSDGSRDSRFAAAFDGEVDGFRVLPDGSFYAFGPLQGPRRWAGRYLPSGRVEGAHSFRNLTGRVTEVTPLPGGEALVSGRFPGVSSMPAALAWFDASGQPSPLTGPAIQGTSEVVAVIPAPNGQLTVIGRILLAGELTPRPAIRLAGSPLGAELKVAAPTDAGTELRVLTVPGLQHHLEKSSDLRTWRTISTVTARGTTAVFEDPERSPSGFYRIRQDAP